jgi:hypothetical protein
MTAKEKAEEMYDVYWYCLLQSNIERRHYWSLQCSIIALDEILKLNKNATLEILKFYKEVREEIINIRKSRNT